MADVASTISTFVKRLLIATLVLSVVLTLTAPVASAMQVDTTTAKSNETGTDNILGATPTRITWEAVVDDGEEVSSAVVQLPEGSSFTDDSSVNVTVLDGTERLKTQSTSDIDRQKLAVTVDFSEPVTAGQRIRVQLYETSLPNVSGDVHLTGTYTTTDGAVHEVNESPAITVTSASAAERISNWLDEQPWVQAWNSVTFLRLFFQPQLVVSSIPTVATGWLISLALVLVGFPLAIPLGLIASFMKISRFKVLHALAAIYTGIIRGTPLFLQIYIAFFGLPLLGVPVSQYQYVFAVLVMSFNSGAYLCEIFRAGIQSIPKGQFEAARSLGMTGAQTMFSVIIPQTVRRVIPTMTSEFILLYKDTSLLAAVGVMELMLYSRSIVSLTGNMTPYIVAAVFYLIVTLPLIRVVTVLEKRLALSDNGGAVPDKKKKHHHANPFSQMKSELKETAAEGELASAVDLAGDAAPAQGEAAAGAATEAAAAGTEAQGAGPGAREEGGAR